MRWAAIEAVARNRGPTALKQHSRQVAKRRGRNIGKVAAAHTLLTLVYWG